ncbi:protein phosphatase 2C domain-containing protein [Rhodococcus sp. NPDC047139]|uniref:protein phosphatase 2C domain-containing protein n=1 Tax=Rhodococcus sp. NPDC047139 TaxID=3155141 RepID=UPI0033BFB90D
MSNFPEHSNNDAPESALINPASFEEGEPAIREDSYASEYSQRPVGTEPFAYPPRPTQPPPPPAPARPQVVPAPTETQWGQPAEAPSAMATPDAAVPPQAATPVVEHAYRTFGAPARLKPMPSKVVEQPLRSFETVRDTVMDWLEDRLGDLRAVSTRGHIHRYLAEVRQDNFAFSRGTNYLALAVSDGVGNAKSSHLGSALASRTIVENEALLGEIVSARTPAEVSLRDIATLLRSVATDAEVDAAEVSTTLTAAIVLDNPSQVGENTVVLAQIGDSPAFKLSRGEWIELTCPALQSGPGDLIDNSVNPLPGHHMASVWVETFRPGETLVLATDGVGDPVKSNGEYADALTQLWRFAAPSPADLLKVLDATVKSFDDDRTIVGFRFGEPQR